MKFSIASILICLFWAMPTVEAQGQEKGQLKIADFRGRSPSTAIHAALDASKEDVVVVLIRGGSDGLIEGIENKLNALLLSGYDRIGLILASPFPDDTHQVIGVLSQGSTYAIIEEAKADDYTNWALYKLVKDAYEEDILPKLKGCRDND